MLSNNKKISKSSYEHPLNEEENAPTPGRSKKCLGVAATITTLGLAAAGLTMYLQPSEVAQNKEINDEFLAYITKYGKSYATGQEFEGRRNNFAKSLQAADAKKQELYTDSKYVNTDSCTPWHVNCTEDHGLVYPISGQDAEGKTFC